MADQEEVGNEDDGVTSKATEIGEDNGFEKDKNGKDIIPDYEVIEEDDQRIAKEKSPAAKSDRRQLSTKEKRDLKKKRIQEGFSSRDTTIYEQNRKIQELETWKNQVEGRLTSVDKQKVDENINQASALFNVAEKNLEAAFVEGDGAKHTKATKDIYAAQKAIEYWQNVKQQYAAAAVAPKQTANNGTDPRVQAKLQDFIERNSDWYNHAGGDEDSEIAKGISNALVKQGLNPASDEFWDELENKLEERGIIGDDEPAAKPIVRKRQAPPVSGGASRADVAGKVRVSLPTQYIQYCRDIGKWDDPKDKARMIKRYQDSQKANEA